MTTTIITHDARPAEQKGADGTEQVCFFVVVVVREQGDADDRQKEESTQRNHTKRGNNDEQEYGERGHDFQSAVVSVPFSAVTTKERKKDGPEERNHDKFGKRGLL